MPRITENTTLAELAARPEYAPIAPFLMECDPAVRDEVYAESAATRRAVRGDGLADALLAGLRRLDELVTSGEPFAHDIWTPREREAEPSRAGTKLVHFPGEAGAPFVLLVPGGALTSVCSATEGYPAAAALNEAGYHAFVLSYRTRGAARAPQPLDDVAAAVRFVLAHTNELGCSEAYAVMGFSGGAYLAGTFATAARGWLAHGLPEPQATVLCYPVIDLRTLAAEGAHPLAGEMLDAGWGTREPATLAAESVNALADATYPPTYLWQCADDNIVSVTNTKLMDERLSELGVEHHVRLYPFGGHGLAKPHDPEADAWIDGVVAFLAGWL